MKGGARPGRPPRGEEAERLRRGVLPRGGRCGDGGGRGRAEEAAPPHPTLRPARNASRGVIRSAPPRGRPAPAGGQWQAASALVWRGLSASAPRAQSATAGRAPPSVHLHPALLLAGRRGQRAFLGEAGRHAQEQPETAPALIGGPPRSGHAAGGAIEMRVRHRLPAHGANRPRRSQGGDLHRGSWRLHMHEGGERGGAGRRRPPRRETPAVNVPPWFMASRAPPAPRALPPRRAN